MHIDGDTQRFTGLTFHDHVAVQALVGILLYSGAPQMAVDKAAIKAWEMADALTRSRPLEADDDDDGDD